MAVRRVNRSQHTHTKHNTDSTKHTKATQQLTMLLLLSFLVSRTFMNGEQMVSAIYMVQHMCGDDMHMYRLAYVHPAAVCMFLFLFLRC